MTGIKITRHVAAASKIAMNPVVEILLLEEEKVRFSLNDGGRARLLLLVLKMYNLISRTL